MSDPESGDAALSRSDLERCDGVRKRVDGRRSRDVRNEDSEITIPDSSQSVPSRWTGDTKDSRSNLRIKNLYLPLINSPRLVARFHPTNRLEHSSENILLNAKPLTTNIVSPG